MKYFNYICFIRINIFLFMRVLDMICNGVLHACVTAVILNFDFFNKKMICNM